MGDSLICVSLLPHLSRASSNQTGMGRQYPEGLLFAAECKIMGKTKRGQISGGEIMESPGRNGGCRANEEEEEMSKKVFCKLIYLIMKYIFSTVVVNIINAYRVGRCCIMEVEQRNSKTPHKIKCLSLK